MIKKADKKTARINRHRRIRNRLTGTQERPRLCVFRSNKHIYAQIIDDVNAKTITQASTLDEDFKEDKSWDVNSALAVGKAIAAKAIKLGIKSVVFDRGGYLYHGRIAQLAAGAREAGLEF